MAPKRIQCLSEVDFGSFLVYSPHGTAATSQKSRNITYSIKNCRADYIDFAVKRLKAEMEAGKPADILNSVLGPENLLIPCPRSAPLVSGALWPSNEICNHLVENGLGMQCSPILERITAVQKSSHAAPGMRPKPADHIASMVLATQLELPPKKITLVDDVITLGATLIAAASHIKDAIPDAEICVFAMVRTRGLIPDVTAVIEPTLGKITLSGDDSIRNP